MPSNNRMNVQDFFKTLCENVYFKAPDDVEIVLPAIMYKIIDVKRDRADNKVHNQTKIYEVVVLDYSPESAIVDAILSDPKSEFIKVYPQNGVYHTVLKYYI